jgi:hypothetical protein
VTSTLARSAAFVAAAVVVWSASPARAEESSWRIRLEAGPGVDANPLRIVGVAHPPSSAFTGGAMSAQGRVAGERWVVDGRWSEGLRIFMGVPAADVLASRVDGGARWAPSSRLELGLDGMARDLTERGGARDLREARGLARVALTTGSIRWGLASGWMVSAPLASGLRVYRRDGPEASLSAGVRVAREHALILGYAFHAWSYPGWLGGRDDDEHAATLEWRWDGPVLTGISYAFESNDSSVEAGSWRRHRVTAQIAADLPLGLDLAARGTLLRSINPSGLILSEQFFVREGDESQNAIELHLARELKPGVELGLKVAHYLSQLGAQSELGAQEGLGFRRTVAQLAVGWSIGR